MTPATLILTGASGYIGSRFAAEADLPVVPVEGDTPDVSPYLSQNAVVIHLAGLTHQSNMPVTDFERINRDWTRAIGEACISAHVPLLFVSTASVYPHADGALLSEDAALAPAELSDPYARTKREAELALAELGKRGLAFSTLRLGSVFGTSPGRISRTRVNRFAEEATGGIPMRVFAKAMDERRPYTAIQDAVRALRFVASTGAWQGEVYNVVTEHATTKDILDMVQTVVPEATLRIEDTDYACLSFGFDDTRIRSLGFYPEGSIRAGIDELVRFFRGS